MGNQVQYHTDYKYYRNYAQNDFLAVMRRAGFIVTMVAMAMTIAHHQHPRQPQHQCRKYKQPWFNPRRQYRRMRKFRREQRHNRQHHWQHTTKQVWGQRCNDSNLYGFVFHLCFPFVGQCITFLHKRNQITGDIFLHNWCLTCRLNRCHRLYHCCMQHCRLRS